MSFFDHQQPILRRKQEALDIQDRQGLLQLKLSLKDKTLLATSYTRIDQVFVVWGLISALIFFTAQFNPISWNIQAFFWSIITIAGTIAMFQMTHFWVRVERLRWVLYTWSLLMFGGVVLTDLSIFLGWGRILVHLCHLWLGLSAAGYLLTGIGLRSRALLFSASIHILGIVILPYFLGWQFLLTGLVMTTNLLIFAESQWDMRPPLENYHLLTEEQKQFNREQYNLRQAL
ncbi:MAG: hypothetical protein QNJ34_08495 [Xenococcaceae cyanobacterium MO_188.B29]|nr:hypothetical protein [Xenococcaceae cyanobacterium MO_188.B29]